MLASRVWGAVLCVGLGVASSGCSDDPCIGDKPQTQLCFTGSAVELEGGGEVVDITDLDGDGVDDLVVFEALDAPMYDRVWAWFSGGDGKGGRQVHIVDAVHATTGDVEGDGRKEVWATVDEADTSVWSLGNQTPTELGRFLHWAFTSTAVFTGPAGELYYAGATEWSQAFRLYLVNPGFSLVELQADNSGFAEIVQLADMDGDGLEELVNLRPAEGQVSVRVGATGLWTDHVSTDFTFPYDVDQDGADELIEIRAGGVLGLDEDRLVREEDINANGGWLVPNFHEDCPLFASNIVAGETVLYTPTGSTSTQGSGNKEFSAGDFGEILAAGDLDADGVCDLVVRLDDEMLAVRYGTRGR